jgi:hypothetical protein
LSSSRHARPERGNHRSCAVPPSLPAGAFGRLRINAPDFRRRYSLAEADISQRSFIRPQRLSVVRTTTVGSTLPTCCFDITLNHSRARSVLHSPPRPAFFPPAGSAHRTKPVSRT